MSEKKTPSKWDFKRALKMLGLEANENNIEKLRSLNDLQIASKQDSEPENKVEQVSEEKYMYGILNEENQFKVVRVKLNLSELEVCDTFDSEPRAILERGKLEAEQRRIEFKQKLQRENKQ